MHISIIIPTYNEAANIVKTVQHLKQNGGESLHEIIVSDGGSDDNTLELANAEGAITIASPVKGRAGQMNYGVQHASGDIYYFVHADTQPPATYEEDILKSLHNGYNCGSYITKFDSGSLILKINALFTRLNTLFVRGGDQSIFVTKKLFEKVCGYKEDMLIMEDYDFLERIWKKGNFKLIQKGTLVSARKYDNNSWLEVQLANLKAVRMYKKGASQKDMIDTYKRMLNYRDNAF